jgi:glycosyltransferase involved in cell wall biosynthesis
VVGNKQLKILLLTSEPFPEGGAATNRMRSYSKGLTELNQVISIIGLKPTSFAQQKSTGIIDGYRYLNVSTLNGWNYRSTTRKILLSFKYLYKGILDVFSENRKTSHDFLILVSNNPLYIVIFFLISKIIGVKYVQDKSEFPFVLMKKSKLGKFYAFLYVNIIYKLFDAFIVMTEPLRAYLEKKSRKSALFITLPMTVEAERFYRADSSFIEEPYIAYCGSMGGNKDGVDLLIKSFARTSQVFTDKKLVLIGDGPKSDIQKLIKLVDSLNIKDKVIFTGKVMRDQIPAYLCNSELLTLCRPSSLQSKGGFPTKLGEYLATAKPVVVTKVGEIPNYLTDGVNAFLAKPDDSINFSDKMSEALNDYSRATKIGIQGREVVSTVFSYKVQSKRLLNFLLEQV